MRENLVYDASGKAYIEEYEADGTLYDIYAISPQHAREWEAEHAVYRDQVDITARLYPVHDLIRMAPKQAATLINPFLPRGGIGLIYGEDGLGKSLLATQLANAVAGGKPFLGEFKSQKGVVVYIQADMTSFVQHERVIQQKDWLEPVLNFVLGSMRGPITSIPKDEDWVQAVNKVEPDLIVFDTLRKIHIYDENSSDTPRKVYGACQRLFGAKPTLVFVHHTRKDQPDQFNIKQGYRGSGAWRADVDCALQLRGSEKGIKLTFPKHRICEDPGELELELDPLTLQFTANPTARFHMTRYLKEYPEATQREAILNVVERGVCSEQRAYQVWKKIHGDK